MEDQLGVLLDLQAHGKHIGIYFATDNPKIDQYIHLSGHLSVEIEKLPPTTKVHFFLTYPDWQANQRKFLHYQIIKRIAESNANKIPYAPAYSHEPRFNEKYEWMGTPGGGLTCATFVFKCFKEIGVDLIDLENWPVADAEDAVFAQVVIDSMLRRADSFEAEGESTEAEAIRQHVGEFSSNLDGGWMRIRPHHVAAAADLHISKPLKHSELNPRAIEISNFVALKVREINEEMSRAAGLEA